MNFANCVECGKIFTGEAGGRCPECQAKMDADFQKVRTFSYANPSASPAELAAGTELPESRIAELLRAGKLRVISRAGQVVCARCGKEISHGTYCASCEREIRDGSSTRKPPPRRK